MKTNRIKKKLDFLLISLTTKKNKIFIFKCFNNLLETVDFLSFKFFTKINSKILNLNKFNCIKYPIFLNTSNKIILNEEQFYNDKVLLKFRNYLVNFNKIFLSKYFINIEFNLQKQLFYFIFYFFYLLNISRKNG